MSTVTINEKETILKFLKKVFSPELKNDGYNEEEITEFASSYLESFDEKNLSNL